MTTLSFACTVAPRLAGTACGGSTVRRSVCAIKLGRNNTAAQYFLNAMFDFAFAGQADMHRRDLALAIDHESSRQRIHTAIKLRGVVVANHDTVVDPHFGNERLHHLPAFFV